MTKKKPFPEESKELEDLEDQALGALAITTPPPEKQKPETPSNG